MKYRYEAASAESVVQLIAASYLRHGYYWYVTGTIPTSKDPSHIDRKLIEKYGIDVSEWERTRRKKNGLANAQYIRFGHWFIIMVTEGHHPLKAPTRQGGEKEQLRDARRVPIRFDGYSISYRCSGITPKGADPKDDSVRKWHAHVRIDEPTYRKLKVHFVDLACHRSQENLTRELTAIPFAKYAPIRRQLLTILRMINDARKPMDFEQLPYTALNLRRAPVKVYASSDQVDTPPQSVAATTEES
ncbi:MAG: hypothetical protein IT422_25230 [Pirellulaceae bacterium]|nr:hypothetical protein [Pirellulaceae bacterium]